LCVPGKPGDFLPDATGRKRAVIQRDSGMSRREGMEMARARLP